MLFDRIFVYGTLRRGEANHCLLSAADCLGPHRTCARYRLLHLGRYPWAVEGRSTAIVGEIYRVSRRQLLRLDRLEAYPSLFTRRLIKTPQGRAWIYLYRGGRRSRRVIP